MREQHWWEKHPEGIYVCPEPDCGVPLQRTRKGTLADGIRAHNERIHKNRLRENA